MFLVRAPEETLLRAAESLSIPLPLSDEYNGALDCFTCERVSHFRDHTNVDGVETIAWTRLQYDRVMR
jgi:hypothetical protein